MEGRQGRQNIFCLYLAGQLPLSVAFWGGFVGSSVCLYAVNLWAFSRPTVKYIFDIFGDDGYKLFILLYYSIIFVWTAIVIIGTWRSAKNYEGNHIWSNIVKGILVINIINSIVIAPKVFNDINEAIEIVDNKGIISFFPTQYDSNKDIKNKESLRNLIQADAVRVIKKEDTVGKSVYIAIKESGLPHEKVRKFFRPVLEVKGFSAQEIDEYFSFYDSSYRGGVNIRLKENEKIVDSLLN